MLDGIHGGTGRDLKMRTVHGATPVLCLSVLFVLSVFTPPGGLHAQADAGRTKMLRVEAGYSSNHGGTDTGISGGIHFGIRGAGTGPFRFEAGAIAGRPFAGLDVGTEVRLPQDAPLGLVLRAGGGLLVEDGFIGAYVRGGGGVEWDVRPRVALRATWEAGHHDGTSGPNRLLFGVGYRW